MGRRFWPAGCATRWPRVEPPVGIEPTTYSLRASWPTPANVLRGTKRTLGPPLVGAEHECLVSRRRCERLVQERLEHRPSGRFLSAEKGDHSRHDKEKDHNE